MRDVVLTLHVVLGTGGLLLGPAWLAARYRGRPAGELAVAYQCAVIGQVPIAIAKRRPQRARSVPAPAPA